MSADPLVTVVTPTTGNACILRAIESVANQSHKNVQHLIVIDKPEAPEEIKAAIRQCKVDVIELPYATGKDRFLGHRIIGASAFIGKGDFFCYLDEDNWFDTDHIAALLDVINRGFAWAYSLRKIVDRDGNFICNDDCESLGKWPSVLNPQDYLIDTNCYFLPRMAAVISSPVWYRRFREPTRWMRTALSFSSYARRMPTTIFLSLQRELPRRKYRPVGAQGILFERQPEDVGKIPGKSALEKGEIGQRAT